jgi:hypothetical protein
MNSDPSSSTGNHTPSDLMPLCSGEPFDVMDDLTEFAAMKRAVALAYREINLRARDLRQVREASPFSPAAEHAALQAIERSLLARDALENEWSRLGFVATPIVENGFICDIEFGAPGSLDDEPSMISMCFGVIPTSDSDDVPPSTIALP